MSQERTVVCTAAETEDWLAMELEERNATRSAAVAWCVDHARSILSLATIAIMGVVVSAMVFG